MIDQTHGTKWRAYLAARAVVMKQVDGKTPEQAFVQAFCRHVCSEVEGSEWGQGIMALIHLKPIVPKEETNAD